MNDSKVLRTIVMIIDFGMVYALILLFMACTSFGDGWKLGPKRAYILSATIGMAIAQVRYGTIIHQSLVSIDRVMRNVFWLVLVHSICTYICARYVGAAGPDAGYWTIWIGVALWVGIMIVRVVEMYGWPFVQRRFGHQKGLVVVGECPSKSPLLEWMRKAPSYRYFRRAYFSDEHDPRLDGEFDYLGDMSALQRVLESGEPLSCPVNEVFCILPRRQRKVVEQVARWCDHVVLRFFYVPVSADDWSMSLQPVTFGDHELYTRYKFPLTDLANRVVKRLFDIVFSVIVLIPIGLLIPWFAWRIKRESPGPIFFAQERTGYNGRVFRCYKFRSMHVNSESDKVQATQDDPRKFAFGDFMRRANLDELPQFWNVLKGDMSVVGPRPHMLLHTTIYSQKMQQYMVRHFVRPGITGWAQVSGWRGETSTDEEMEGRVKCDIWYMEHWSFWLDLRIILLTIRTIFVHDENAY